MFETYPLSLHQRKIKHLSYSCIQCSSNEDNVQNRIINSRIVGDTSPPSEKVSNSNKSTTLLEQVELTQSKLESFVNALRSTILEIWNKLLNEFKDQIAELKIEVAELSAELHKMKKEKTSYQLRNHMTMHESTCRLLSKLPTASHFKKNDTELAVEHIADYDPGAIEKRYISREYNQRVSPQSDHCNKTMPFTNYFGVKQNPWITVL